MLQIGDKVQAKTKFGWMPGVVAGQKINPNTLKPVLYKVKNEKGKEYSFSATKVFPDNEETDGLKELEKLKSEVEKAIKR